MSLQRITLDIYNPTPKLKYLPNVSGKLVSIETEVGQSVTKGDVLAQSSSKEAALAVIRAESALSSAHSRLTTTQASAQARIESQLAVAQETLIAAQATLVETKSLAEMRIRNQRTQAEIAYQAAKETIETSKTNAEQALERAKVERDDAKANFARNKSLHDKQLISDSNFEAVEKRLKLAETRLEEAKATAAQFAEDSIHPSRGKSKSRISSRPEDCGEPRLGTRDRFGGIEGHPSTSQSQHDTETCRSEILGTRDCYRQSRSNTSYGTTGVGAGAVK